MDNPERLHSSSLAQRHMLQQQKSELNPTSEHRRRHAGQMGTALSAARWDKMSSLARGPSGSGYLRNDGLAVAGAEHEVVHGDGGRVCGALRRALPQPGALPAACKAAETRGTQAETAAAVLFYWRT